MAKKTFIALTGLVILVVAVWFVWLRPPTAAPMPMPNPNGYDDFRKAGQLLVNTGSAFWELDHEKLRAYVLPNAEALELLRVGLTRECRVPIEYSMASFGSHVGDMMQIKRLWSALSAEGTLAVMEHRTNDAAMAFLDFARLGQESSRGGLFIDGMVAHACEKDSLSRLQKLTTGIDGPTCREIIKTLEILEAKRESPEEILRRDREWARKTYSVKERIEEMIESKSFNSTAKYRGDFIKRGKDLQRQNGLLLIDLAAHAFELEKGRRPQSAKELVPDYLKAAPKDPTTGVDLALPK